ncbi:MAG: ABC transporter ATP-binding protein [Candidatus Aminicenantes bacterium]|nr:ABC transporter ATP-binding protein [Candidatus Aminicenantes bacterium]
MTAPILEIRNLSKAFGPIQALNNVSLIIPRASLTIIAGPDGSGKSTLLKCLLGLVRADAGQIYLKGQLTDKNFEQIRSISAYMSERFSLYPDLTVEENLDFYACIQMVPKDRKDDLKHRLLERTGLESFRFRLAANLSGGLKQKLALATALLSSPEILFLDEPTPGIDPTSRLEFFRLLEELKKEGRTIILTTPYLDEAEKGDEIVFFHRGKIIKQGSLSDLKNQFPLLVFSFEPETNIFEAYTELSKLVGPENLILRGRQLKIFVPEGEELIWRGKLLRLKREEPRLEDIYFYFERRSEMMELGHDQ